MDDLTKEPIEEKISNLEKCKKGIESLSEAVSKSKGGFPVFHAPPPPPVVTHDERILGKILEEMYSTYVKKNAARRALRTGRGTRGMRCPVLIMVILLRKVLISLDWLQVL